MKKLSFWKRSLVYTLATLVAIPTWLVIGIMSAPNALAATAAGPNNASSFSFAWYGSSVWVNPQNAALSDNVYATISNNNSTQATSYFKAEGFNFAIPSGAVINGVSVNLERGQTTAGAFYDEAVFLIKNDVITSTGNQSAGAYWPTSDTVTTFGGSGNTWGQASLTPSDINNSKFGFAIAARKTMNGTRDARIDYVNMTVYYTVPDTESPVIQAHSDITVEATSAAGAVVTYTAPDATDNVDATAPAICTPASGSTFPLGETTVTCNKTDAAGNHATPTTFKVTVQDTTAPSTPIANPVAGEYQIAQDVTLFSSDLVSATPSIYYTTDGSDPDNIGNGILYSGPINISTDLTLKAIAYDEAGNSSSILTAAYDIAPVISSESSVINNATSFTVNWVTNQLASSRVIYDTISHPVLGLTPNYDYANSTPETDTAPEVLNHSVTVDGLVPGVTYYFRTVSQGSPESVSAESSITTPIPTSPSFTVKGIDNNGNLSIHVDWNGVGGGVDGYLVTINGISTNVAAQAGETSATEYDFDKTVSAYGTYSVSVQSKIGSVYSTAQSKTVEIIRPVVVQTVAASTPNASNGSSTGSSNSSVTSPTTTPSATTPTITPSDDQGQIKGAEDTSTESEEPFNWTPWIILIIIIVLAGAATGGYFYWTRGDEAAAVAPVAAKVVKKSDPVKPQAKKAPSSKKNNRW